MPRKPRVNTSGRKPGRPVSSVRTSKSYYIKKTLVDINKKHANEIDVTESSIVEKLLEDYYGLTEKELLM